jgi:uncharacterized protein YigE (DUF2233 family)
VHQTCKTLISKSGVGVEKGDVCWFILSVGVSFDEFVSFTCKEATNCVEE